MNLEEVEKNLRDTQIKIDAMYQALKDAENYLIEIEKAIDRRRCKNERED